MPDRPLLRLLPPESVRPAPSPRGASTITRPGRARQAERLSPKFDRLVQSIDHADNTIQLQADPSAIAPERAIVFEIAGSLPDFYRRAASIGLEYLADDECRFPPDEDFHALRRPADNVAGRAYLAMPDLTALRQLVSLWRHYTSGTRMRDGFGMWTELFQQLHDLRPWGPQDRILPETMDYWAEQLAAFPNEPVRFEVEFWYRENANVRRNLFEVFTRQVAELGGRTIHHAFIPEIRYDSALIDLPAIAVRTLLENPNVTLARLDSVMFIRPQSLAVAPIEGERESEAARAVPAGLSAEAPIAALLDGLPVQNHQRLANRLLIDDPDGFETEYIAAARRHGTEMASLIIHGDLALDSVPLSRPLYVRPVLRPAPNGVERTPPDRLLVDLIYRAVRRIKEGDGEHSAVAPSVILFNISLGDQHRSFTGQISPWARLLDYLSYRYRVLFLVSAGNVLDQLQVRNFLTWTNFEDASAEDRQSAVLAALNENKAHRTLLSPAESLNAITVGAAHRDSAVHGPRAANVIDPFLGSTLPNISSAVGLGHKRVIKPDILLDGGRELVRMQGNRPYLQIVPAAPGRAFGLVAAAADPVGADLTRTTRTSGTSAATALATRAAHLIYDVLMDRAGGSTHSDTSQENIALLIKALLIHGAAWGEDGELLERLYGPHGQGAHFERRDNVARFLGYGYLHVAKVLECTANRATVVGHGTVAPGNANLYRIPIPAELERVREFRAVTVSLAWFSPINPRHQSYRSVALEAGPGGDSEYSLGVRRAGLQPHDKAARRGSVFHERREGEKAAVFIDGGDLLVRVSCRATTDDPIEAIPYALVISLEVGVNSQIRVYDNVRAAIEARVRPAVPA